MNSPKRQTAIISCQLAGGPGRAVSRKLDEDETDRIRVEHARMLPEVGPLRTVLDRVVIGIRANQS